MIHRLRSDDGRPLDASDLDAAYAVPPGPWVRANFAVTLDGAVEVDGRSGAIGGPDDRRLFAHLRSMADVVLVGSGTVRAEGYGPVRLDADALRRRAGRGQAAAVPVAVVTTRGDLDPEARLFREAAAAGEARPLVLTTAAAPASAVAALEAVADVERCGADEVDDRAVLDVLRRRRLDHVLCEGGPTLSTRLIRRRLVDELCLTIAPLLAGPGHVGLTAGTELAGGVRMGVPAVLGGEGGVLFTRYRLRDHDTEELP